MAQSPTGALSSAIRALQLEMKKMQEEPVEGFRVQLVNDDDISEWEVAIFGPPGTLYEGGYFKVNIMVMMYIHRFMRADSPGDVQKQFFVFSLSPFDSMHGDGPWNFWLRRYNARISEWLLSGY